MIGALLEKVRCRSCIRSNLKLFKLGLIRFIHFDTKLIEVYCGIMSVFTGMFIAYPSEFGFSPDIDLPLFFNVAVDIPNAYIGIIYVIVGCLIIMGALFAPSKFRRNISLVMLYLWLCMFFHVQYINGGHSIESILYAILSIEAAFIYLSLWRYRWI